MAVDERLVARLRRVLAAERGITERKMFGGLCVLADGKMACGVLGAELMVRVGAVSYEESLRRPYARPMDFTGTPMKGMVYVGPEGLKGAALKGWVMRGLGYARSVPAKKGRTLSRK
jgi:TfoX/Sxy family transcriptional regulator of competence genes